MQKFSLRILIALILFTATQVHAQIQAYDRVKTRTRLLQLAEAPPARELVLKGKSPSAESRQFVEFYQTTIWPKLDWMRQLGLRYMGFRLLRDSGSQTDAAEFERWTTDMLAAYEQYNAFLIDTEWTASLHHWAQLGQGLNGELADLARLLQQERELESFPPELKPLLDEVEKLETEYGDALRNAPGNADINEFGAKIISARRAYKNGEMTFTEAQSRIREIMNGSGNHFVGFQAVQAKGENLNRTAILRSRLARSKGFPTWAAYALELSGQGYVPEYRGPTLQREFLEKFLLALKPIEQNLVDRLIARHGLKSGSEGLRNQDLGYLKPRGLEMLQPYFPNDQITRIWHNVLQESGFDSATLNQILVDDGKRENKNLTEAYLAPILAPFNRQMVLKLDSLNFEPISRTKGELEPGLNYILQSYSGMGLMDLNTAFHEGGHALENLLKFKGLSTPEGYGYREVPSMTSERFTHDAQVLWNHAVPVDGQKPSLAEIEELLENFHLNEIFMMSQLVGSALFDLELWDYDYAASDAVTYLHRVETVSNYIKSLSMDLGDIAAPHPFFYNNVSTTHFTSGDVRHIGYVYAEIASRMMTEHISDQLERQTGRRSWYRQPEFAKIFADFAQVGWQTPFPLTIEQITGRPFDFREVVASLARRVNCEEALKQ